MASVISSFIALAQQFLSQLRLQLLFEISRSNCSASRLIRELSRKEDIAPSTLWYNLRMLKRAGFVKQDDGEIKLTSAGAFALKRLVERKLNL